MINIIAVSHFTAIHP